MLATGARNQQLPNANVISIHQSQQLCYIWPMVCRCGIIGLWLRIACAGGMFSPLLERASATVELFTIDPAATSLTLQIRTGETVWKEQGPAGLRLSFRGWLALGTQAASLQIVQGSILVGEQTIYWQPGPTGSVTSAPANYGAEVVLGSGIATDHVIAAVRNLEFAISSPPLATGQGLLPASTLICTIPLGANSTLDFRANGLVIVGGSRTLDNLSSTNADGEITLSVAFEVQTLTVPIDVTFNVQVPSAGDTSLRFVGSLVAKRGLTFLNPQLLWLPNRSNGQEFTLVWDYPFKLQKAATLDPASWIDLPIEAPAVIQAVGDAGFFRLGGPN
jgi:hypothetical protein